MSKRKPLTMSPESWAEQQILDSQRRGEFDNLPYQGKPLPGIDGPYDEMWWLKDKLSREKLGLGPPTIEVRRETEAWLETFHRVPSESTLRKEIGVLNGKIRAANQGDLGPLNPQARLDPEALVIAWREARD